MQLKQLSLSNLGRFKTLDLSLAPTNSVQSNVTILIGQNGGGKTTILKALATSLSWLGVRIRSDKSSGNPISEEAILNGTSSAAITLSLSDQEEFNWVVAKSRSGRKGEHASQLIDVSRLSDKYRNLLSANENTSLPLIAFYPVERSVLDISLKIKGKHPFSQLDGYENSLNQGVDFRRFFEWFRDREDMENEVGKENALSELLINEPERITGILDLIDGSQERFDKLEFSDWKGLKKEFKILNNALKIVKEVEELSKDPQLTAVRNAITSFMPDFSDLKVRRKPRLHMSIDKSGETLNVAQLSQGEKSLMALVGDIARRLAMLNPGMENPLHGDGVVLIDEVDMHLHPQWARTIIERLTSTFPNCQFVLTTHSPLVISDCKDILVYALNDGDLTHVPSQYGQDANTVLLDVMNTHIRNATVTKRLNDLLDIIQDGRLDEAKALMVQMETELPSQNLELAKARLLLRKEVIRRAAN